MKLLSNLKYKKEIAFVAVFLVLGSLLIFTSHAATPASSIYASNGSLAGNTQLQTDSYASNGKYVLFNHGSTGGSSVAPTVVGHQLNLGNTGTRLKMQGVAIWGVEDPTTGSFGLNEYNDMSTIISTVKSWGANYIRVRALSCNTSISESQQVSELAQWQKTAQAAGLYTSFTWWDPSDCGSNSHANWPNYYSTAFPMMKDLINAIGPTNQWTFYEPFNEPNNISDTSWINIMQATDQSIRSDGYKGILVFDTNSYSHEYNDSLMTQLENYDASQSGMNGVNQVIFAKHDYANEYPDPNQCFIDSSDANASSTYWPKNTYGNGSWSFSKHLVWETEFGNYNGSSSTVHYVWSHGAANWMNQQVNNGTIVGATAFLYGPWYDANAITASDNTTPTQWGGYVENNFLKSASYSCNPSSPS